MKFTVNEVNYELTTTGEVVTVTKEGETEPMFTVTVDQTKTPEAALQEVVTEVNTFLTQTFVGFIAEFVALFAELTVQVVGGVPVVTIPL